MPSSLRLSPLAHLLILTLPTIAGGQSTPSLVPSRRPSRAPSSSPSQNPSVVQDRLNVLIVTADQLRYDAVRFIQDRMQVYDGKLKVRTPNIDRLATESVVFETVYAQGLPCTPSRATLRSGCTIRRTGMQNNGLSATWMSDPSVARRVNRTQTYDQLLSSVGYQAESYGKWHLPNRWFFDFNQTMQAILYDGYSPNFELPEFSGDLTTVTRYRAQLAYWNETFGLPKEYRLGDQVNPRSLCPYQPMPISRRYGLNEVISDPDGEGNVCGIDRLTSNYSQSAIIGRHARNAIRRLATGNRPWVMTVSFENPHPPYIVSADYASYYLDNQDFILTPPNMDDMLENVYYASQQKIFAAKGYTNRTLVKGFTAIYYGMIEQVDTWVGTILDELQQQGVADKTLVVFTSDHGEFLGAHGLQGKFGLLEEALRVPLFIRLPGTLGSNGTVKRPVSHIDLLSTILDYVGHSSLDQSDGKSLRSLIEKKSYRKYYEDEFVVSEANAGGAGPGFMVRLGQYKLMIAKLANSTTQDLFFDLQTDPFEQTNMLPKSTSNMFLIGKVEHMKRLLLEWMQRNDGGSEGYYSSSSYSTSPSRGDITEITARRTWPAVNQWMSDTTLVFNRPVLDDGKWRSHAWLYLGRTTTTGKTTVKNVTVTGTGQQYFSVSPRSAVVSGGGYVRFKVAFAANAPVVVSTLNVSVVVQSSVYSRKVVSLSWV